MTPNELSGYLSTILSNELRLSLMIWGAPGIGKSSIVAQAAAAAQMDVIDVRLSQLAPTDLRGLPVPERLEQGFVGDLRVLYGLGSRGWRGRLLCQPRLELLDGAVLLLEVRDD
jgi:MoxR-like ATPase